MIEQLFKQACLEELQAMKPGNVHMFADGHGMTLQDFITSAEAAAGAISAQSISLGERIFNAVEATHKAVHTNTNLGIVLLCAPLVQAKYQQACEPISMRISACVKKVLESTTVTDAALSFKAIALANPGGLGECVEHDVHQPADCTLMEAMQRASGRDLVARQYRNHFADIFDFGIKHFEQAMTRWESTAWATTDIYLNFLASYLDSHIVRKYGENVAKIVQNEAKIHLNAYKNSGNPKTYLGELLRWDADLKAHKINPGTCADLTVATLLAVKLEERIV